MRVSRNQVSFGHNRAFSNEGKTKRIVSAKLVYIIFTLLVALNILTLLALYFNTDISKLIFAQNNRVLTAYEDRVTQLRIEVDRLYSRQYAQSGNLNLQLIELAQQQAELSELQPFVKSLVLKAEELGLANLSVQERNLTNNKNTTLDNLVTGSISSTNSSNQQQVLKLQNSISQLTTQSHLALKTLSQSASDSTKSIISELSSVGSSISFDVFDENAVGGPYIDNKTSHPNLVAEANNVLSSLEDFEKAKNTIRLSPVLMPLSGKYRLSSAYGKRNDPFNRQSAFHSGMDFAAPKGNIVRSAGAGVVSFSGRKGGYGIVVEIKHSNGILTRYAHLSASLVKVGQSVDMGDKIAKVGSTGRSTGSHLHFEVRREDKTLNPQIFINVGDKLAKFI